MVIAAQCPSVGKQALPGIHDMLRSIDVFSSWRLLPDLQTGIAHIPGDTERGALLELLGRVATTSVGVGPRVRGSRRYRRGPAVCTRGGKRSRQGTRCGGFDGQVLAVAAVSAPEVTAKVADLVLGAFGDMTSDEQDVLFDTFRAWVDNNGSIPNTATQLAAIPIRCATGCTASRNAPGGRCLRRVNWPNSAWHWRVAKTVRTS